MTRRFGWNHELITAYKSMRHRLYRLRPTQRPKVFGIGLSRTGTKSLHRAFTHLGYRSEHFPAHLLRTSGGDLTLDLAGVRAYDAMTDTVASVFFRELDVYYPGSKFVLTVRDIDAWVRSCRAHFASMEGEPASPAADRIRLLRQRAYGRTDFDAGAFRAAYLGHVEAVKAHFHGRDDLLVIDICNGRGWEPLCRFLGIEPEAGAFPWANRRAS